MSTDSIETTEVTPPTNPARRRFLAGSGLAAAAVVVAACGGNDDDNENAKEASDGDLEVAAVAAGLELLAVNTYTAALDAAGQGALGDVPAAVGQFVTTARDHHQAAFDAWNGVLDGAGKEAVTEPLASLNDAVNTQLGAVTDIGGAAQLALMLEQTAAATYLKVIPTLESTDAIALAGSILPIDMQHASVLLFVLGQYPVPDTFGQTAMSAA